MSAPHSFLRTPHPQVFYSLPIEFFIPYLPPSLMLYDMFRPSCIFLFIFLWLFFTSWLILCLLNESVQCRLKIAAGCSEARGSSAAERFVARVYYTTQLPWPGSGEWNMADWTVWLSFMPCVVLCVWGGETEREIQLFTELLHSVMKRHHNYSPVIKKKK